MDGHGSTRKIDLHAKAGEVSAELARRGIAADAQVHVHVLVAAEADLPAMAAFDWLTDEPDLYTDADLVPRRAG